MPLRVTYCGHCGRIHPEFMNTIAKLRQEHPQDLRVIELECMAACDESPVAMVEYDFFSKVVPKDFYEHVKNKIGVNNE